MPSQRNSDGAAASRPLPIYKDLFLLQLAALVFLLDQFSKFLVREFLSFGESFPREGFFRITHTYNTGSAFGLFQGQNTPLILVSFIGITILVLIYRSQPQPSNLLRLSLGLQMGGAAGNLLDRLLLGHVIDFIGVGPWPLFNLADASIVVGILLLVWLFLRPKRAADKGIGVGLKPAPTQVIRGPRDLAHQDGYRPPREDYCWCPICDGDMVAVREGWQCSTCGVRETIDQLSAINIQQSAFSPHSAREWDEAGS